MARVAGLVPALGRGPCARPWEGAGGWDARANRRVNVSQFPDQSRVRLSEAPGQARAGDGLGLHATRPPPGGHGGPGEGLALCFGCCGEGLCGACGWPCARPWEGAGTASRRRSRLSAVAFAGKRDERRAGTPAPALAWLSRGVAVGRVGALSCQGQGEEARGAPGQARGGCVTRLAPGREGCPWAGTTSCTMSERGIIDDPAPGPRRDQPMSFQLISRTSSPVLPRRT